MARATRSLPVPVSPQMRTVTSARAACRMISRTSRIWGLCQRASSCWRRRPRSSCGSCPEGGDLGYPLDAAAVGNDDHRTRIAPLDLEAPQELGSIGAVELEVHQA